MSLSLHHPCLSDGGWTNKLIEINRARVPDEQYTFLIEQAQKCRNLARGVTDEDVVETLLAMAASYERRAGEMLERGTDN